MKIAEISVRGWRKKIHTSYLLYFRNSWGFLSYTIYTDTTCRRLKKRGKRVPSSISKKNDGYFFLDILIAMIVESTLHLHKSEDWLCLDTCQLAKPRKQTKSGMWHRQRPTIHTQQYQYTLMSNPWDIKIFSSPSQVRFINFLLLLSVELQSNTCVITNKNNNEKKKSKYKKTRGGEKRVQVILMVGAQWNISSRP